MLELRPTCEHCNKALPPSATDAMICTYECTFCSACVDAVTGNVCPNCGGGFERRPVRPATEWRPGLSLELRPASTERKRLSYEAGDIAELTARVRAIAPEAR